MSSLNDFISSVRTEGLMTSSRFSVEMALPPTVIESNLFAGDVQKVLLHCESAQLPGVTLSTTQARTFGEIREMPYERLFDNVQLTFYVDNTMQVKQLFDTWMSCIQNPYNRTFGYYRGYTTDIGVSVYDKNEQQRYNVMLYECYPKAISAIQVDFNNRDVMKLQVSINYKYWLSSLSDPNSVTYEEVTAPNPTQTQFRQVPDTYFTDFNSYQSGFNSFENARSNLFETEVQSTKLGSIFT